MRDTPLLATTLGFLWLCLASLGCGDSFSSNGPGGAGGVGGVGGIGGTGGGSTNGEDCLNGADDDADDLVDCDDPDCQAGFACVPALPAGWLGVGWITSATDTPCPAGLPAAFDVYDRDDLVIPPAACECTCGPPTGIHCIASTTCYSSADCNDTTVVDTQNIPSSCTTITLATGAGGGGSCRVNAPVAVTGSASCEPSNPEDPGDVVWEPSARACLQSEPGLCSAGGQACVPKAPAAGLPACVVRTGDFDCPAAFPDKQERFDGQFEDSRECPLCACGPVQDATCGCASCGVEIYNSSTTCLGTNELVTQGPCQALTLGAGADSRAQLVGSSPSTSASCQASSAPLTGVVAADHPVTVCCVSAER